MDDEDAVRAAISRYVPEEQKDDEAAAAAFLNRELLALAAAPRHKREETVGRLLALDAFSTGRRSRADLDEVLRRIGGQQSNVYRLLRRMKEAGPVTGLVRNMRVKEAVSVTRSGFDETMEMWIGELLAEDPGMKIAEITRRLASRLETERPGSEIVMPKATALRRRLLMLRQERGIAPSAATERPLTPVGGTLLVDQALLDVTLIEGPTGVPERCSAIFMVDGGTSLILGFAIYIGQDPVGALRVLAERVRISLEDLAPTGVKIARLPTRLRWVMPPTVATMRKQVRRRAKELGLSGGLVMVVKSSGFGTDLVRLVGMGVPPFDFRIRGLPDDASIDAGGMHIGGFATLEERLQTAVEIRNRRVLGSMGVVEQPSGGYVEMDDVSAMDDATVLADLVSEILEAAVPEPFRSAPLPFVR